MNVELYEEGISIISGQNSFSIMENDDKYIAGFNYCDTSLPTEMVIDKKQNSELYNALNDLLNNKRYIEKFVDDESIFIGKAGDEIVINITTKDDSAKLYVTKNSEIGSLLATIITGIRKMKLDESRLKKTIL